MNSSGLGSMRFIVSDARRIAWFNTSQPGRRRTLAVANFPAQLYRVRTAMALIARFESLPIQVQASLPRKYLTVISPPVTQPVP